jgi:hypothetical protein
VAIVSAQQVYLRPEAAAVALAALAAMRHPHKAVTVEQA